MLCHFDLVLSPDLVFHYTTVWEIRQPSVKLLTCIFWECDTVEGSFAVNGGRATAFVCLTINLDDMHLILSIFSIKAVYRTNIGNEEVQTQ